MDELETSDNLVPNEAGSSMFQPLQPEEDRERKAEEADEQGKVLASALIYDDILSWFDDRIASAKTIEGINFESRIPVDAQVLARQVLTDLLEQERGLLATLKERHIDSNS